RTNSRISPSTLASKGDTAGAGSSDAFEAVGSPVLPGFGKLLILPSVWIRHGVTLSEFGMGLSLLGGKLAAEPYRFRNLLRMRELLFDSGLRLRADEIARRAALGARPGCGSALLRATVSRAFGRNASARQGREGVGDPQVDGP